ncbi:MAG TPA: hypothetical protein VK425_01810 [Acidimicrobiales bacterium]|nr:hypothetical protein [Acidimicrobiales bacterium]
MTTDTAGGTTTLPVPLLARSTTPPPQRGLRRAQGRSGLLMTGPFLVLFALFFVAPLIPWS